MNNPLPGVSIVVPAYNSGDTIEPCLAAVLRQEYPVMEVAVVDDGSTDDTRERASRFPVSLDTVPENRGTAHARNLGAETTRHEILVFIDSDVVIPPGSLEALVRTLLARSDAVAVGATYSENSSHMNYVSDYKNLDLVYRDRIFPAYVKYLATFFFAVRRKDFVDAGRFSTVFPGSSVEDLEFCFRLCDGRRAVFMDKTIEADHLKRFSLGSMVRTNFIRIFNFVRVIKMSGGRFKAGTEKSPVYFANLLFPWLLILAAAAGLRLSRVWIPLVVLVAFLLTNHGFLRFLKSRRGVGFAAKSAVLLLVEYLCAGVSLVVSTLLFVVLPVDRSRP